MRVNTLRNGTFDFGLSGREMQDRLNVEKYVALAYSSPLGVALANKVEEHWSEWLRKVSASPWLRNWSRSELKDQTATTPKGKPLDKDLDNACLQWSNVALYLYVSSVWGFGVDKWLQGSSGALRPVDGGKSNGRARVNEPMAKILNMQNVRNPSQTRTYMWDDVLYRGCGLHVPIELGELDRWLEPLWLEVISSK